MRVGKVRTESSSTFVTDCETFDRGTDDGTRRGEGENAATTSVNISVSTYSTRCCGLEDGKWKDRLRGHKASLASTPIEPAEPRYF